MSYAITFQDITAAAKRLKGITVRTPLLENMYLNEAAGGRVFLKAENLQHIGAFKFRGAYNRLVALSLEDRQKGVVAWSSGNHAQGVAAAAKMLGITATIVMPSDAPVIKVNNTRDLGATIRFYDRLTESREAISYEIAAKTGAIIVPSYDDPFIMAGQGTVGLEIMEDLQASDITLDHALIGISGGGLSAGSALAVHTLSPATSVYTVEPEDHNDTAKSLEAGKIVTVKNTGEQSICDALLAPEPGKLTFPILHDICKGGLTVSDTEVKNAVRFAFERLKLVLEPGGAVSLAAILSGKLDTKGKTTAIVLSGGNIDHALFSASIAP